MKRVLLTLLSAMLIAAGVALQFGGGATAEASAVTVQVNSLEQITLTMGNPTVDFGSMQPGTAVTSATPVEFTVNSNVPYDLSYSASGLDVTRGFPLSCLKWGLAADGSDAAPLNQTGAFLANEPKVTARSITHYYTLDMPWSASPGAYAASVIYTAVPHQ